jgi:tRNA1(Val) A37 N6-methylase TrmN6
MSRTLTTTGAPSSESDAVPSDPGLAKAATRRPDGWVAPGPRPRGAAGRPDLAPTDEEDLSFLCGDFRIFQRKVGHRWSLDDFATAVVAIEEGRSLRGVRQLLDLGCGIGSVLLMTAWAFPGAQGLGIEAQELSVGLARRSLAYDGVDDRIAVVHGDLREEAPRLGRRFDLVTGTPPYLPLGHGQISERAQRGPAFFETRGGIEDYAAAAAALLAPGGVFVACAGAQPPDRGLRAAERAGLVAIRHVEVVPREGKPLLFTVTAMVRPGDARPLRREVFRARDAAGRITPEMHRAREVVGMPPVVARPGRSAPPIP